MSGCQPLWKHPLQESDLPAHGCCWSWRLRKQADLMLWFLQGEQTWCLWKEHEGLSPWK